MRTALLLVTAAWLWFPPGPATAGDPPPSERAPPERVSGRNDALLEAVARSPVGLDDLLDRAGSDAAGRRPLRAAFVLDAADRLVGRVLLAVGQGDEAVFEEWMGPVHDGGWVPRRRVTTGAAQVAEAERLRARVDPAPEALRSALAQAVRTEERADRPADVALSVAPTVHAGKAAVTLRVGIDGTVRGLRFDVASATFTRDDAAAAAPERVPYEETVLPPLVVPGGRWFNAEEPPSFSEWRGHVVLVLVTDPG